MICNLGFGIKLSVIVLILSITAYLAERRALKEASAVICSGGRFVGELGYGAPSLPPEVEKDEAPSGLLDLLNIARFSTALVDSADGENPNNFVEQAKRDILAVFDISFIQGKNQHGTKCG